MLELRYEGGGLCSHSVAAGKVEECQLRRAIADPDRYPRKSRTSQQLEPSSNRGATDDGGAEAENTQSTSQEEQVNTSVNSQLMSPSSLFQPQTNTQAAHGQASPSIGEGSSAATSPSHNSPDMLYANIAERSVRTGADLSSYSRDYVFLGETFSLTYVVNDVLAPFLSEAPRYQKHLHFPLRGPAPQKTDQRPEVGSNAAVQIQLLKNRGLFHRPGSSTLQKLLKIYFEYFHFAFPLVDLSKYLDASESTHHSQLVLNSILMIAATLCDDDLLKATGFESHHAARQSFYNQARCLYDADAEPDKLNNITALFLMSFWWGGPTDMKDSWHWMGTAITIAKSLGLHRS